MQVVYANTVQANVGGFDAVLDFGIKADRTRKEVAAEDFQVEIIMSVDFLRALNEVITMALKGFDSEAAKTGARPQVVEAKNEQ